MFVPVPSFLVYPFFLIACAARTELPGLLYLGDIVRKNDPKIEALLKRDDFDVRPLHRENYPLSPPPHIYVSG